MDGGGGEVNNATEASKGYLTFCLHFFFRSSNTFHLNFLKRILGAVIAPLVFNLHLRVMKINIFTFIWEF